MSGSNETNQNGNYGILGIPDESNMPSSREYALGWTDSNGNLWLFGGTISPGKIFYQNIIQI
jgi:hypothetical protein